MIRFLVVDTESWRASALLRSLWPAAQEVAHVRHPQQIASVNDQLTAAIVVMRDPLQLYLAAIRELKSRTSPPDVLAIFAGGSMPGDYALMAARARGADAILYHPHSEAELRQAVHSMVVSRLSP